MKDHDLNLSKLVTNDKLLIVKSVKALTETLYKENNTFITNQLLKTGTHETNFGKLWLQAPKNSSKTIQNLIDEKYRKIAQLQDEIATLDTYADKTQIIATDSTPTLYSKPYTDADNIAKTLLQDLISDLGSKRLSNQLK